MTAHWQLHTDDGLTLEAEWATPPAGVAVRAAAVLCHPHPQHGGSMRSIVISALFDALPQAGIACVRFNYRGVGASEGTYGEGIGEQRDARAAADAVEQIVGDAVPLFIIGWSFGGDVTLASADPRARALVAVAPPLRSPDRFAALAHDRRPKLIVLAANDEVIDNDVARQLAPTWPTTSIEEVIGASHYFVGRTDVLVGKVLAFLTPLG